MESQQPDKREGKLPIEYEPVTLTKEQFALARAAAAMQAYMQRNKKATGVEDRSEGTSNSKVGEATEIEKNLEDLKVK